MPDICLASAMGAAEPVFPWPVGLAWKPVGMGYERAVWNSLFPI